MPKPASRITTKWLTVDGGMGILGLTPDQMTVLVFVIEYAKLRDKVAKTSQVTLAEKTGPRGLSRPRVQRALKHLESIGAIVVMQQGRPGKATEYVPGTTTPTHATCTPECAGSGCATCTERGQVAEVQPARLSEPDIYKPVPDRSLPPLPKALRAADDDEEIQSIERIARRPERSEASTGSTGPAGQEAAQVKPPLEPRKTSHGRVPAQPQTARDAIAWPTAVPGQPGVWKETA